VRISEFLLEKEMSFFQTFLPRRQFFQKAFSFLAALAGIQARPCKGAPMPATTAALSIKILDETGKRTPARVYLRDSSGQAYFAPQTIQYNKSKDGKSEQHFVPPDGTFSIDLPSGSYSLEIERGKEYLPIEEGIQIPKSGHVQKTIRLKRWVWMARRNWYSADMHVHASLRDVGPLMEAEDLNAAVPLSIWRVNRASPRRDSDLDAYLAKADEHGAVRVGENRWFTALNEELETSSSAILISNLNKRPLPLEYPMARTAEGAKRRGALVDSEKATALELPALAALGLCNFVGLANNHFWRAGCHVTPWGAWPGHMLRRYPKTCVGFALAGFEMYYALLNVGIPLKLSAGSAYGVHPVPMGWTRVYVHVRGKFNAENWFKTLYKGSSFVTTGPMMFLTVNGLEPGDESTTGHFPLGIDVDLRMLSSSPLRDAEIVVNGSVHPVTLKPEPSSPHAYRGKVHLTLKTSSWVAARYLGTGEKRFQLAHSSPIYFYDGESPIPVNRKDAEFLLGRVQKLIEEIETGKSETGNGPATIVIDNGTLRQETLEYLKRAIDVYRSKVK
jgi:hypothetical protein